MTQQGHRHSGLSERVLKVMGIFSGVQVLTILCSIVRTKCVALWLGPAGVGLFGIYNSVVDTASAITQMGTGTGVVRALAMSPRERLARLVAVTRRWAWALGLTGALLMVVLSPVLSRFTFGDEAHCEAFVLLGVGILLLSLSANEASVFQGLKRYRRLAKSTVAGALLGLIVALPILYIWRIDGVLPSVLAFIVAGWLCRGLYRERVGRPDGRLTVGDTIREGREFVVLGLFMTITTFTCNAVSYIFMSYLNRQGGMEIAGLYQGGFTLVNRYVGLVLGALGMEYMPRLSQVSLSRVRSQLFVTHEVLLIGWLMLPIVVVFIVADELIIRLLYDSTFLPMLPFVGWAMIGTVARGWSWVLAFNILARGDGLWFLITELISAVTAILLNILFYNAMGIAGLGYAYLVWYLLYSAEIWLLCRVRYGLRLPSRCYLLPLGALLFAVVTAVVKDAFGWGWTLPLAIAALLLGFVGLRRLLRR